MSVKSVVTVAAAIFLALGAERAGAEQAARVSGERYAGCRTQQELQKLNRYAAQGDENGWANAMAGANMRGECTMFRKGEPVFVIGQATASGLIRVRRREQSKEYWTLSEAVD